MSRFVDTAGLKDLGWLNNWKTTPDEVIACREKTHKVEDVDVGPPNRGLEHVVCCRECKIVYRYDSSD